MAGPIDEAARAARRRETYSGSVVRLGDEKPALFEGKTPTELFFLQASLVYRLATFSGGPASPLPRSAWPGEVFDIDERNRRAR